MSRTCFVEPSVENPPNYEQPVPIPAEASDGRCLGGRGRTACNGAIGESPAECDGSGKEETMNRRFLGSPWVGVIWLVLTLLVAIVFTYVILPLAQWLRG